MEVLSVYAGNTIEFVEKHRIYVFPNDGDYKYKKFKLIIFRNSPEPVYFKLSDILSGSQ